MCRKRERHIGYMRGRERAMIVAIVVDDNSFLDVDK